MRKRQRKKNTKKLYLCERMYAESAQRMGDILCKINDYIMNNFTGYSK